MRTLALVLLIPMAASAVPPRFVLPELPPPMPAEELKDPAALADRIAKNSKSVSDRLADAKTENETLRDQKQVKDDLDALIKLLEPPSPPPPPSGGGGGSGKNDPPPPSGSGGSKGNPPPNQDKGGSQGNPPPPNQDKNGSQGNSAKQPAAPQPPMGAEPKPASAGGGQPGQAKAAASLPALPPEESLARDFWGNLPDAPRQQMMQFYREQYMTKYKDLLSQYYQSLAEKEKKK